MPVHIPCHQSCHETQDFADKLPSSQLHAFLKQLDGILHVIGASLPFTLWQLSPEVNSLEGDPEVHTQNELVPIGSVYINPLVLTWTNAFSCPNVV